jgi:hypothetical protein
VLPTALRPWPGRPFPAHNPRRRRLRPPTLRSTEVRIFDTVAPRTSRLRRVAEWAKSDYVVPRLVRLPAVGGFCWALLQVGDRFNVKVLPDSGQGLLIFALSALNVFLLIELVISTTGRSKPEGGHTAERPEHLFASSLLAYARSLAAEGRYRDHAIVELHAWSSRLLHLMGAVEERIELGRIAMTAASVLRDRRTQAAILIDDLGWSNYEAGDHATAIANIEEAIGLLDAELQADPADRRCLSLKVKAVRHLAGIRAESLSLEEGRRGFAAPRALLDRLDSPDRALNEAQIDHSEATAVLHALEKRLGRTGQIDPTGDLAQSLNEAIALAEKSEGVFHSFGDLEREAKALKVKVGLLSHDARGHRYREAAGRLARLEREVARHLR